MANLNAQNIILVLIVASATLYIASMVWKKVRSYSPKTGCDSDCGCDTGAKKNAS